MRVPCLALMLFTCLPVSALQIGAARVDITPDYPIRLCGYFARKTQSDGVEQHVFAKALAISADDGNDVALLITVDSTGVPANVVEEVAKRLHDKAHVARERLVISSSHSHCAPWLGGYAINIFGAPVSAEQQATVDRYTKETTDHIEQAALAAIADRKPGKLAWGVGEAGFATNRRTKGGPVDRTMPMLLATDLDGKPRAIVCNYACHNTTLGPEFNKVCGDWAGYAQAEIEKRHPGVIAMITLGCAGDANPMPRGKLEQAQQYGAQIADAADKVLAGQLTPLTEALSTELKHLDLPLEPLPTKEQWEALAKRPTPDGGNARLQLAKLNRGEKLDTSVPYVIETWTFGKQLAMVFLAGEVVVDYDLRLKHDFDASRLWVSAYSNDVPCYIPSKRILTEGGYEGGGAMVYYAKPAKFAPAVENDIIHTVHTMLPVGFRSEQSLKEYPPAETPKQEQQSLRLPDGLKAELVVAEPLVTSPVAIDWGLDGRLWVCEMNDYPNGRDENLTPGGQIKVLESTKHDGHYDKATVFLDHLRMPTGVMVCGKGILVCAAPDIIYAEDTKGTGKADVVKVLYTGFGPKNEQWLVNGLAYHLDNWIYGASSIANDPIHSTLTGQTIDLGNRDFRIHPETGAFEPAAGRTQYCRPTDDAGNPFGNDNSNLLWNYPLPEHYLRRNPHAVAPRNVLVPAGYDFNQLYPIASKLERFNTPDSAGRTTSACGPTIYRDDLLGHAYYGNAFGCEPANNVVYHLLLEPKGVTFTAHRAPGEEHSDFLTSTDDWFRPVQARTAPDGSLWVVDMYRFVIEHPRWIPPDRMARLDLRAGSDMGRIWRILPKDATARPIPDLSHASPAELAKAMDTSNGTLRDTIQRVLVERRDTSCASTLEDLARKAERPAVRLQALCTLDGLGAASPQLLLEAMSDKDPSVRRHAVRIAEPLLNKDAEIAQAAAKLVDDADAHVRYQVALSLGEWNDPRAAEALGRSAVTNVNDGWFRAAVASSSMHCAVEVLKTLIAHAPDSAGRQDLVGQLVATAAADEKSAGALLTVLASSKGPNGYDVGQFKAIARLLDTLEQRDANPFPAEANDAIAAARKLAADSSTPQALRVAALSLLARGAEPAQDDLKQLAAFLQPQSPAPLQSAATAALARAHGPKPAALLLERWKSASPAQRTSTLNVLVSRPEWAAALLDAIEKGKVQLAEVPVATRVRLSHLPDDALHRRADAIFSTTRPSTRREVLKQFEPALSLKGDVNKGRETFIKTCTTCHLLEGQGHAVGPDLSALTDRSPRALMIAILDPNAAVDGKFVSYDLQLKDGRSLSGIIESETASSVTLVQPTGIKETLPRTDLVKFHSSGLSLMPEGLEAAMTPQDLADLIEYVRTVKHQ